MSSHKGAATFLRAKGLCSQYVGVNLKKNPVCIRIKSFNYAR